MCDGVHLVQVMRPHVDRLAGISAAVGLLRSGAATGPLLEMSLFRLYDRHSGD